MLFGLFVGLALLAATLAVGIAFERQILSGGGRTAPPDGGPSASLPPLIEDAALAALVADPPREPLTTSAGAAVVTVEPGPSIDLPDGRLVAGDVYLIGDQRPFVGALPAGETGVWLLLAAFAEDQRVAAVLIGDRAAIGGLTWTVALSAGREPPGPDELPAFPVDSGTAAFTSAPAVERIRADAGYPDLVLEALQGTDFATGKEGTVRFPVDEGGTLQVLAVPSGWGDGAYVTWAGTDAGGGTIAYLTSFDVLDLPGAAS
jgi:hypothetical protein